ncbi:MAG: signal peptidase II [Tepidimonas sp.]|uniref:signal peptidase II n=1 Tax=Tepidimonas sp. TaxID=2002775 RepID=UPI00259F8ECF|nr:signal peptidase II [Tepidimonas sp.]MDM7455878.1 signal peptidase II [Tepidimonas sp.]
MTKNASRSMLAWLGLAFVVVLLDQISKGIVMLLYRPGDVTAVTSFFNIVRVHNPGAAFSFLAHAGGWQRWFFTAVGIAAVVFILWMLRAHARQRLFAFSLSCLLGGAVGNLVDRLVHGYVVDMLDVHFRWLAPVFAGGHFPAFNLADAAITAGAIGLIVDELRRVRRSG